MSCVGKLANTNPKVSPKLFQTRALPLEPAKGSAFGIRGVTPHSVGRCREATEGTGCSAALDPQAFEKA